MSGWRVGALVGAVVGAGACVESRTIPCGELTCPESLTCDLTGVDGPRCVKAGPAVCGDGVVEVGEECDCGSVADVPASCPRSNGAGFAATCGTDCRIRRFQTRQIYGFPVQGLWASRQVVAGYIGREPWVMVDDRVIRGATTDADIAAVSGDGGDVAFVTTAWDLVRYDAGTWRTQPLAPPTGAGAPTDLAVVGAEVLAASGGPLFTLAGDAWQPTGVAASRVASAHGRMVALTATGVAERKDGVWQSLPQPPGTVRDVAPAPDGTVWVATDSGVAQLRGSAWRSWATGRYTNIAVDASGAVYATFRNSRDDDWLRRITRVGAFNLSDPAETHASRVVLAADGDDVWFGGDGVRHVAQGPLSAYLSWDVSTVRATASALYVAGGDGLLMTPPDAGTFGDALQWTQMGRGEPVFDVCETAQGRYVIRRDNADVGTLCQVSAQPDTACAPVTTSPPLQGRYLWCQGNRVVITGGRQIVTWDVGAAAPRVVDPGVEVTVERVAGGAPDDLYAVAWRAPGQAQLLHFDGTTWRSVYDDATADRFTDVVVAGPGHLVVASQRQLHELRDGEWRRIAVAPVEPRSLWIGDDGAVYAAGNGGVVRGEAGRWSPVELGAGSWRSGASAGGYTVLAGERLVQTYLPNAPAEPGVWLGGGGP